MYTVLILHFLFSQYNSFVQNAPGDVMKAIYDVCFNAVIRIILQSDEHSEIQVILFDKNIHVYLILLLDFAMISYCNIE